MPSLSLTFYEEHKDSDIFNPRISADEWGYGQQIVHKVNYRISREQAKKLSEFLSILQDEYLEENPISE